MNEQEVTVVESGARVRLRQGAPLAAQHPELADAVGIVGSVIHGPAWRRLGASAADRARDATVHVRFRSMNVVALNVPVEDVEAVDHLAPMLPA